MKMRENPAIQQRRSRSCGEDWLLCNNNMKTVHNLTLCDKLMTGLCLAHGQLQKIVPIQFCRILPVKKSERHEVSEQDDSL